MRIHTRLGSIRKKKKTCFKYALVEIVLRCLLCSCCTAELSCVATLDRQNYRGQLTSLTQDPCSSQRDRHIQYHRSCSGWKECRVWGCPGLWIGLLQSLDAKQEGLSKCLDASVVESEGASEGIRVGVVKEHSGLWRLLTLYSELWLTANMTKKGRSGVAILGQHAH